MTYNVFIRGIYSTSLTKLFKDKGYNIIFPSQPIMKRFADLKDFSGTYSKEILINDRYDKEGVSVTVKKEIWDKIKDDFPLNQKDFPELIKLDSRFSLNSIHKGIVIQSNRVKNYSIVRLIPEEHGSDSVEENFRTTLGRVNRLLKVGTEDIFQVVFEDVGKNYAYLNRGYTVSGDLAVIMPRDRKKAFISKKIKDKEQREKLNNVIEKVSTNEFGILLRTAAQFATELEILREIQKLRDKYLNIETLMNQTNSVVGPIHSEFISINFVFTNKMKEILDDLRGEIVPTLRLHHDIKAGINLSRLSYSSKLHLKVLNLVEGIVEDFSSKSKLENYSENSINNFKSFYFNNLYSPKQFLKINHYKLNGRSINLKPGVIKKIERVKNNNNDSLRVILRRNLGGRGGNGLYDGLDIPIEDGDYAIGVYESNNMYYETIYYSRLHELKGKYFNVNTPISLRPEGIHYIDLEIDVVEPLNKQTRKIIDKELLDKAYEKKIISEVLYKQAIEMAEKIKNGDIKSILTKESVTLPVKDDDADLNPSD